jgi:hypothetical protein
MTGWAALDRFLRTDPADVGCEQALAVLHVYVELVLDNDVGEGARRYPGVAAHLLACGPCQEDFEGVLAAGGDVMGDYPQMIVPVNHIEPVPAGSTFAPTTTRSPKPGRSSSPRPAHALTPPTTHTPTTHIRKAHR